MNQSTIPLFVFSFMAATVAIGTVRNTRLYLLVAAIWLVAFALVIAAIGAYILFNEFALTVALAVLLAVALARVSGVVAFFVLFVVLAGFAWLVSGGIPL
jgi:hypothetical protein